MVADTEVTAFLIGEQSSLIIRGQNHRPYSSLVEQRHHFSYLHPVHFVCGLLVASMKSATGFPLWEKGRNLTVATRSS